MGKNRIEPPAANVIAHDHSLALWGIFAANE